MKDAFPTYLIAHLPGWFLLLVLVLLLHQWHYLPAWAAIALLLGWVAKDLLLFPAMSRYYRPESAAKRILGERGTAVTDLAPDGVIRVRGELWQARAARHVREGSHVQIENIEGLRLLVTPTGAGDRR